MKFRLTDPFLISRPDIRGILGKLVAAGFSSAAHHETTLPFLKLHGLIEADLRNLQKFAFPGQPVIDKVGVFGDAVDFVLLGEIET